MITYYKNTTKKAAYVEQKKFSTNSWVYVNDPKEEELQELETSFNLDRANLDSGLDQYEIPRIEHEDGNRYVIMKYVQDGSLETLLIILGKDFILTLSKKKPTFLQKILDGKIKTSIRKRANLFITILSQNNQQLEKTTLSVVKLVNSKKVKQAELSEKDLKTLLDQESLLNSLVGSYYHTHYVYQKLEKVVSFKEEDRGELEDLDIETKQGFDLCKSSLKSITNLRNHYVILLSNKLNKVITLLTLFTIIISVPAAISGLYGMNVRLPFQDDPNTFLYVVGIIVTIWLSFLYYFKKGKFL